jgi:hypothetical protein
MKNSKLDNRLLLAGLVAGLAACAFAACSRRTLTAGAVKAPLDARAPDGANETAAPPDGTNADTRDPEIDTSPDGQSLSDPCGEATCLIDLFRTCVPEGSCATYGRGSPSASFSSTCYANGVQVNSLASNTGTFESDWDVRRDDVICYEVKGNAPTGSRMTYTITGGKGEQVATGSALDQPGFVTVTCQGGQPTVVSSACLDVRYPSPRSTCSNGGCPGYPDVDADGTGGTGGGTGGSGGGTGGSISTGGTSGGSGGGAGGGTSTGTAAGLRCTLPRGPDAEPGMTCKTYCDDLTVMCKSTPGVPATTAECVDNCMANFSELQLCCRSAHLMNGTGSAACEEALGRGTC